MAKIISVSNEVVEIGDEGVLIEVRRVDLNFEPRVGDYVSLYKRTDGTVAKVILEDKPSSNGINQSGQGININLSQNQQTSVQAPTHYVGSGKVVNKLTYVLLAIFVGWLGFHKFYAGKTGSGIIYMFTVGLFGIGWFIDIVVGALKKSDSNGNIVV